jgi:uncharacterized protein (DUF427 family)
MNGYPGPPVEANHIEPSPRRIRGFLGGEKVFDTTAALYVWETSHYPQYYVPVSDVREELLVADGATQATGRGSAEILSLRVGAATRPGAVRHYRESPLPQLAGTMRFQWDALDAWLEEDEQVYGHPRSPYVRVDALRSTRHLRIELGGALLAESRCPVLLFETGVMTRYYVDRSDVRFEHLRRTDTVTECPYKGVSGDYWSADVGIETHEDIAWSYRFPTRQVLPIAGLVAFYNERVDIELDGVRLERPGSRTRAA